MTAGMGPSLSWAPSGPAAEGRGPTRHCTPTCRQRACCRCVFLFVNFSSSSKLSGSFSESSVIFPSSTLYPQAWLQRVQSWMGGSHIPGEHCVPDAPQAGLCRQASSTAL